MEIFGSMKNILFTLLLCSVGSLCLSAQETSTALTLDGKSITYTYQELGTVRLDFADGLVRFEWLKGPNAGNQGEGSPYQVKLVAPKAYFLNWIEEKDSTTITLFINLEKGEVHSSGIVSPGTEQEMHIWHSAKIEKSNI